MSEHAGEKPKDERASGENEDEEVIFPEEDSGEEAEAEPSDLEKARTERDRMRDQLLRIAADFDNFRLREVLPIVDNLERAAVAMTDATEVSAVTDGVHMVLRGFEDIAERLGLKRVTTVGRLFDPTCHDAMQQQETDEHAPGTIVAEIVPGYHLGERLLRPAMVVVAKPPTGTGDQGGESAGGDGGEAES
ncbi:MAG: nucleotide exchange factor GrpE, partial [Deltaproteobacteria bacterium]|nr:nucleotide exchange factor GrpE [Deltaproteobacteria bacterium]